MTTVNLSVTVSVRDPGASTASARDKKRASFVIGSIFFVCNL